MPFPDVGTHVPQPRNHRLPLWGIAGSQKLGLMVPTLRTIGYHCKELPVATKWNSCFPTWEPEVTIARNCQYPEVGRHGSLATIGYHCKELPVAKGWNSWLPTWEPEVTIARNCWFPKVGTHGSQRWNHQCKELLIPKGTFGIALCCLWNR